MDDVHVGEVVWKPIVIVDEFRQSKLKPFDFIFAPYNDVAEADGLYKVSIYIVCMYVMYVLYFMYECTLLYVCVRIYASINYH